LTIVEEREKEGRGLGGGTMKVALNQRNVTASRPQNHNVSFRGKKLNHKGKENETKKCWTWNFICHKKVMACVDDD
jgi:hypothetical protein